MTKTSGMGMLLCWLLVAVAFAMGAYLMILQTAPAVDVSAIAVQQNQVSAHGIEKHPEASAIEEACNKSIFQVWKDKYDKKYYYLCRLPGTDKWGIIPVVVSGGAEVWKTAFSPGSGCWSDTLRYLGNTATRFTGVVK